MIRTIRCLALPVLLTTAAALPAQQNVGINVFRGSVTLSGVLCGFDCNDPGNVGRATVQVLDTIGVRLIGDVNLPAAVVFGIGPTVGTCPFLVVPGIGNSLIVDPATMVMGPTTTALSGPNRSCGSASANQPVANGLQVPPAASGALLSVQGLVFDAGAPAFTRAVEISIQ